MSAASLNGSCYTVRFGWEFSHSGGPQAALPPQGSERERLSKPGSSCPWLRSSSVRDQKDITERMEALASQAALAAEVEKHGEFCIISWINMPQVLQTDVTACSRFAGLGFRFKASTSRLGDVQGLGFRASRL